MDIEHAAQVYITRRETDPRQYAINYRNALIFLALGDTVKEIVPLSWAMTAMEDGWEVQTRSINSSKARRLASAMGLKEVESDHPLHQQLWEASLAECVSLTSRVLSPSQQKFSNHHGRRREAHDNSYYVVPPYSDIAISPQDAAMSQDFEGAQRQITTNRYERKPHLRFKCLAHAIESDNGRLACKVCDLDFAETYGTIGEGFIHVHHLSPLGGHQREQLVDPKTDLVPVCPNCHAMLHRGQPNDKPRSIEELRQEMTRTSISS